MYEAALINVANTVQLVTILLTILGFLPQLIRLCVTKDSTGLSRDGWILWGVREHDGAFLCPRPLLD